MGSPASFTDQIFPAILRQFSRSACVCDGITQTYQNAGNIAAAKTGLLMARALGVNVPEKVPHLTLHRLKDLLAKRGVWSSHDTVWRFLRREGQSFKKNALRD